MKKMSTKILMLILFMAIVASIGIFSLCKALGDIVENSTDIVQIQVENLKDVSDISKNFADIKGNIFIHVNGTTNATYDLYEKIISESISKVDSAIARYEERNADDPKKMAELENLKTNYNKYIRINSQAKLSLTILETLDWINSL